MATMKRCTENSCRKIFNKRLYSICPYCGKSYNYVPSYIRKNITLPGQYYNFAKTSDTVFLRLSYETLTCNFSSSVKAINFICMGLGLDLLESKKFFSALNPDLPIYFYIDRKTFESLCQSFPKIKYIASCNRIKITSLGK